LLGAGGVEMGKRPPVEAEVHGRTLQRECQSLPFSRATANGHASARRGQPTPPGAWRQVPCELTSPRPR
jgi:hypothetical protein